MARISSWLNPLKDIYGTNYQIINGFVGYTNGGLIGRGFGNSIMKFGYIPEAQSDFISSIIVEELGLVGFAAFLFLILLLFIDSLDMLLQLRIQEKN